MVLWEAPPGGGWSAPRRCWVPQELLSTPQPPMGHPTTTPEPTHQPRAGPYKPKKGENKQSPAAQSRTSGIEHKGEGPVGRLNPW